MVLEAIKYSPGKLLILDQLQLPHREHYDEAFDVQDAYNAIKSMRVRGAPAIAIVAALGLAVELQSKLSDGRVITEPNKYIADRLAYLLTSRPTAVNLADAAEKLTKIVNAAAGDSTSIIKLYIDSAVKMLEEDVQTNQAIGKHGADWIMKHGPRSEAPKVGVLTHCNTGSLATAGYGTALGVIRALHQQGHLKRAFCTETRPYNQGSRLTAFELVHDGIPSTLITDSMAAALFNLKRKSENIVAVVVGADRVAANGDTANKIGTYALSILARAHGVKFLVAAPRTTIDMRTATGADIKIEERAMHEMTSIRGPKVVDGKIDRDGEAAIVSIAAEGIDVWNPAFDVTPADMIDGIVTEVGVVEKDPNGLFDLGRIMQPLNGH